MSRTTQESTEERVSVADFTINVGPVKYSIFVVPGRLLLNGREVNSLCHQYSREILIAGDCPPDRRLRSLIHCVARAWTFEVCEPTNEGDWYSLLSLVGVSLFQQLPPSHPWVRDSNLAA
jgi:hypothetical protein